jgi:hypothetical protein
MSYTIQISQSKELKRDKLQLIQQLIELWLPIPYKSMIEIILKKGIDDSE